MWLRKRRSRKGGKRIDLEELPTLESVEKKEPSMIPFVSQKSEGAKLQKHSKNYEKTVGWDDVRCRPIYGCESESTSSTSLSSSDSDDDDGDSGSFVVGVDDDNSSQLDLLSSSSSPTRKDRSPPSYPIRKKILFDRSTTLGNGRIPSRSFGGSRKRSASVLDGLTDDNINMNCLALPPKKNRLDPNESETSSEASSIPNAAFVDNKTSDCFASSSSCALSDCDAENGCLNKDSVFEFQNEDADQPLLDVRQPSSKTSLSVARTFFEQLDKGEQLVTMDESSCTPIVHSRPAGRTRRRLPVSDLLVKKDYKHYCNACKQAGVKPLQIEDFVRQRSTFFRSPTSKLYDGFLDD